MPINRLEILLILTLFTSQVFGQNKYFIPSKKDSATISKFQYDFNSIEKPISDDEIVDLLNTIINTLDTNSCFYFTGYESYYDFEQNLTYFKKNLPAEIKKNVHLIDLDKDGSFEILYDRLNFGYDFQAIYLLQKIDSNWEIQNLSGFIIVDCEEENGIIKKYHTFQWACCDFPYDFYFLVNHQNDTLITESKTAFYRNTEHPKEINVDTTKSIITTIDSVKVYSSPNDKTKTYYQLNSIGKGYFIEERLVDGENYVYVKMKVNHRKKFEGLSFDYYLGWIKKENLKYLW